MKRENSPSDKLIKGVQLFSDMMLMKFKPKNTIGSKQAQQILNLQNQLSGQDLALSEFDHVTFKPNRPIICQLRYVELASKQAVIIGNYNQIDMINIDGLCHNFVDTFYYWSLNLSKPIMSIKVSIKKQLLLILTGKTIFLYGYNTIKKQKSQPRFISSRQLENQVKFMQFPTSDMIALFYEEYFQIYSLNDANILTKKLQKKYGLSNNFKLFAVPQAIDHTINIFFEQSHDKKKTFGLWCIQIKLLTDNIKINHAYKIYDIMNGLKKMLILENYSKDIVFLNLGQQILVAKKGYIVDSVNINLQIQTSYLRYLPRKQILVHIEQNTMDLYSFKININTIPHRIQLSSLDSIQIKNRKQGSKLISLLPVFQHNYALFYQDLHSHITTKGQVFYSFVISYTVQPTRKINQILNTGRNISQLSQQQLQAKCDILRKIGLSDQQIYLQIWRRSTRSTVKDFQYILATRDYKTIKNEIQNKLRKQSMSFKQVLKIEQSCLNILRPKIQSQQCNEQLLKDYLSCSLFLRKLNLYKQLHILQNNTINTNNEQQKIFYLNIQDYYNLKNIQLKQIVIQKVNSYLFNNKNNINQIRIILHHFRFVYRYIYRDLLEKIIKISKNQLRKLLQAIPQLLPIDQSTSQNYTQNLQCGVWCQITDQQLDSGLYLQKIQTIFNKQVVRQFIQGLWYKRNMLTAHDFIAKSCSQIKKLNKKNNSIDIFYYFIDKTFDSIKDPKILKNVLSYLQKTYNKLPSHLKDHILLYSTLYNHYKKNYQLGKCPQFNFAQFLQLKDYNLFHYFFNLQKMKKNTLLKQIKPIYQQVCGEKGFNIFNISLFNYFKSEISEISNLKYLLNRINNQKKQFHIVHQQMYQILIKAMQFKLKIGSSNDIPVDQVLIYVQNIPISKDNKAMIKQLQIIQKIGQQSQIFRKMRINMTIRQIIDNYEIVIQKLIQYLIKKNGILNIDNISNLLNKTYRILAQVQSIKQNIYGQDYNQLAFFIYLTKLLEHQHKILISNHILNDQYLNKYYFIDLKIIQSLVLYMYRWKFSQNPSFISNQNYILKLCQLLPIDNPLRDYIQNQLEFAVLLSTPNQPVLFPVVTQGHYPRVLELSQIINEIGTEDLVKINIEQVINSMKKIEEYSHNLSQMNKQSLLNKQSVYSQKIQQNAIYKTFIFTYINRNLIKQVIPLIKKSIKLSQKNESITTLIMIYNLLPQLNQQSRITIIKIISYLYLQPLKLLQIIQNLLCKKFTGLQSINYLHKQLKSIILKYSNFNQQNPIFNIYFVHLSQIKQKKNKILLVQNTLIKLKKTKIQFNHQFMYDLVFIILCYQPFSLAIFLRYLKLIKWKTLRNFISYLVQQEIFDQLSVLQVCKRIFALLLRSYKEKVDIERLVKLNCDKSLIEQFKIKKYQTLTQFEKVLQKNVAGFQKKKNQIMGLDRSFKLKKNSFPDKQASIKQSIKNPQKYKQKSANDYAFTDSDDNYEPSQQQQMIFKQGEKKKHSKIKFDPKYQRRNFIRKDQKQNIEARKLIDEKKNIDILDQVNQFNSQIRKNNSSKMKKYFSMDVRSGYDQDQQNIDDLTPTKQKNKEKCQQNEPPSPTKTVDVNSKNEKKIRQQKSFPTFESQVKNAQRKQSKKYDEFGQQFISDQQSNQPSIYLQNKVSDKQLLKKTNHQIQLQQNANILLKKILRTYDETQQTQPYNILVMHTQKVKNPQNYLQLFKHTIYKIYYKPQNNMQIAFKLLKQISQSFSQLQINKINIDIFQKIAKFQTKYGLQLPLDKILPYQGLFMKNNTPEELFNQIKQSIIEICDDQNIFKISKLISIGFKKNIIEQEIIYLFLVKIINQLNQILDQNQLNQGLQKIKGLVNKLPVKILVQRTEKIVDQCTHFDLRRKVVQIFIQSISNKGNSKDAKQLANKLK